MSLAARCTHCRTVFRINGAHLAAAQGWVRCGGCSQVFDAASNLVTPSGQAVAVPTVTAPEPNSSQTMSVSSASVTQFQAMPDIDLELPDLSSLKAEASVAATQPVTEAQPLRSTTVSGQPGGVVGATVYAPSEPTAGITPESAAPSAPLESSGNQHEPYWVDASRPTATEPVDKSGAKEPVAAEHGALGLDTPKDTRENTDLRSSPGPAAAPRGSLPLAPARSSGLMGLSVVLLTLTLVCLLAYAARGHIAQSWPETRPLVLEACKMLGCQLPALRQIDSVKIEGSSLSKDDASGHHRLRVQLRNADESPIWTPAFDLTLVDVQGEVLARRMIDPLEFQPALAQLDPGTETALSITLDLRGLDPASVSSFRLSVYYP